MQNCIQLFRDRCRKNCARDNRERQYGIWSIHCSWHCSCRSYFSSVPLALANIRPWPLVPFLQISLKNSKLRTGHNTFRDCRLHCFQQPFLEIAVANIRDLKSEKRDSGWKLYHLWERSHLLVFIPWRNRFQNPPAFSSIYYECSKTAFSKISTLEEVFEKMLFRWQLSPGYMWKTGQTGYKKISVLKQKKENLSMWT